jgi:hypothetical protein
MTYVESRCRDPPALSLFQSPRQCAESHMSVFQYGLMGSALAAGLALFGAITFGYAWYPDVVRAQLGTFLAEGKELLRVVQLEQEPVPLPAAEAWHLRVMGYLASAMGQSFARRFVDSSRLPVSLATVQSDGHRNLEIGLRIRITRLERFLSELEQDLSAGPGLRFRQRPR